MKKTNFIVLHQSFLIDAMQSCELTDCEQFTFFSIFKIPLDCAVTVRFIINLAK